MNKKTSDYNQEKRLRHVRLSETIYCLFLVAIPFWFNIHYALVGFFYALLLYRYITIKKPQLLPRNKLLSLIALLAGLMVLSLTNGVFGKTAGTSLLLIATGLKLLEIHSQRDSYLMIALGYLLALTQFLFNQDMSTAGYMLVVIILLTTVLIGLHCNSAEFTLRQRIRFVLPLILQAVPLAVFLFFLFPRIPGPLWSFPDEKGVSSGLGDKLEPGSINDLSLSDELAFRVNFKGPVPAQNQLYWRGPVFWWTDGQRWEMRLLPKLKVDQANYRGTAIDYTIIMEPHGHKWMLALDLPQQIPTNSYISGDFQLSSNDNINERRLYDIRSYPDYRYTLLQNNEKWLALQLPQSFRTSPLMEIVNNWRQDHTDQEVVQQALAYFHNNNFYYSLHPPRLTDRPVERFLLETRKGFCEHYATAFVVLMRLSGIPARVVTGYQGGQWNELGRFLEVSQSDAHAWAEVWLNEQGWQRVDPTAAVAPQRIEKPFDYAIATDSQTISRKSLWHIENNGSWIGKLAMLKANMDHGWHQWILGYNHASRDKLLTWLSDASWDKLLIGFSLTGLLILLPFLWSLYCDIKPINKDPVQYYYLKFCQELEKMGVVRIATEGPVNFSHRAMLTLPRLRDEIQAITDMYLRLRYAGSPDTVYLKVFQRLVKNIKLK